MAYLISLEFLYRLFEQLSILYSDGAEREVPLEYLRKHIHTEFNKNLIGGVGLAFCLFIYVFFFYFLSRQESEKEHGKLR